VSDGPLRGLHVVELAGLGPAPLAAMILAGMGATVVRIDRSSAVDAAPLPGYDLLNRGRPSVAVDLKHPSGVDVVHRLAARSDVFIEGFRPGVAERLGLGPEELLAGNPALIYARMTGWGQDGPLAPAVGHDINYIALTGALHAVGNESGPVPPLNLVGDFGGGTMLLVSGILAALYERRMSGRGQVVDAAMVDGVTTLMTMIYDLVNIKEWTDERRANLLDGGAPFYGTYECADGGWIAVGAIEPQFFSAFEQLLGAGDLGPQWDRLHWPATRRRIAAQVRTRSRDAWCAVFAGSDACVSPVRRVAEVADDPHIAARGTVVRRPDGTMETTVPPRFSRTPTVSLSPTSSVGADTRVALARWGFSSTEVDQLIRCGAVAEQ
jgi:alpha-methylacyl-CoA racemase